MTVEGSGKRRKKNACRSSFLMIKRCERIPIERRGERQGRGTTMPSHCQLLRSAAPRRHITNVRFLNFSFLRFTRAHTCYYRLSRLKCALSRQTAYARVSSLSSAKQVIGRFDISHYDEVCKNNFCFILSIESKAKRKSPNETKKHV